MLQNYLTDMQVADFLHLHKDVVVLVSGCALLWGAMWLPIGFVGGKVAVRR